MSLSKPHINGTAMRAIYGTCMYVCMYVCMYIPYLREKGPMGGAPYTGSRLGDGLIFEVSLSQLDAKECPGKLPTQSSLFE